MLQLLRYFELGGFTNMYGTAKLLLAQRWHLLVGTSRGLFVLTAAGEEAPRWAGLPPDAEIVSVTAYHRRDGSPMGPFPELRQLTSNVLSLDVKWCPHTRRRVVAVGCQDGTVAVTTTDLTTGRLDAATVVHRVDGS